MMKKILLLILLFAGLITKAQFPNTVTGGNSSTLNKQLGAYGANLGYVWTAAYSDTTAANLSFIKNVPGIVIRIGNDLWMRSANVLVWIKIGSGASGGNLQATLNLGNTADTSILLTFPGAEDGGVQAINGNGSGVILGTLDDVGYISLSTPTSAGLIYAPVSGSRTYQLPSVSGTIALTSDIVITNFANTNLTQTAARTYAGAGFNYTLNNLGHWTFNLANGKNFDVNNAAYFSLNTTTNDFFLGQSGNAGVNISGDGATTSLTLTAGTSAGRRSEIVFGKDSMFFKPIQGIVNIDSLQETTDTSVYKPTVWNPTTGSFRKFNFWPSAAIPDGDKGDIRVTNSGVTWTVDTSVVTPIKIAESYDKKRGNPLGLIFEQSTFADLDTFTVASGGSYVTATTGGGKIILGDNSTNPAQVTLNRYTGLQRWTTKARFTVGEKSSDSYGFHLFMFSDNTTFIKDVSAEFTHRTTGGFDGYIKIYDGDHSISMTTLATSLTNVSFSQDDEIEFSFTRNLNVFTAIARNVTTGGAEVSVSYVYNGLTTAVNTGRPGMTGVGLDSVSYFSFYSDESKGADLMLQTDSKGTWYGNWINQAIPSLMYGRAGNVISYGGSGDKTAETILTTDQVIALHPKQLLYFVGSNDPRNGVSSGTTEANIDTIYNRYTRSGIDVYFALAYETSISQATLRSFLLTNYADRYIDAGYDATLNCGSCLLSDNIHLNAYGKEKWVDAIMQSGYLDFLTTTGTFKEMKFRAGDLLYTAIGDSTITHRYFNSHKLNVFREGELQWKVDSYEASSYEQRGDTIVFHPPLSTGERIVIQSYNQVQWTSIRPDTIAVVPLLLDLYPGAAAAYSTRQLRTGQDSCMIVRRSSDNAEQLIGFVNGYIDAASLLTFVGGGDGFVKTWVDATGQGRNATQATTGNQPKIVSSGVLETQSGKASVSYSGGSQALDAPSFTFAQPTTMFVVAKNNGAFDRHFIDGAGADRQVLGVSGGGQLITYAGAAALGFGANSTAFNLHTAMFNNASSTLSRNNAGTVTGLTGNSTMSNGIRIGSANGASGGITGYISEVIFYASDKTSDMTSISDNINAFFIIY